MRRSLEVLVGAICVFLAFFAFSRIDPDAEPGIRVVIAPLALIVVGFGMFLRAWLNQPKAEQDLEAYLATIPFADGSLPSATAKPARAPEAPETAAPSAPTNHPVVSGLTYAALFVVSSGLMAGLLAQNGRNLFAPEMRVMLLAGLAAATYVSWRVGRIITSRIDLSGLINFGGPVPGVGPLSGMSAFRGSSSGNAAMRARRARVEAARRKLSAEGKLDDVAMPETGAAPTRVAKTAPIKDRMAARAERVRRARAQGKLD